MDKRDKIMAAIVKSKKSYDEILKFLAKGVPKTDWKSIGKLDEEIAPVQTNWGNFFIEIEKLLEVNDYIILELDNK